MSNWMEGKLIIPARPKQGAGLRFQPYQDELRILEGFLVAVFGGFTVTKGEGAWRNDAGAIVREQVLVYMFSYDSSTRVTTRAVATLPEQVRCVFEQEAVYLSTTRIEGKPIHE